MHMSIIEIVGYTAAVFNLAAYSMKTMIPLRVYIIGANCLFLTYGYLDAIYPTLILHAVLLPLNAVRLIQMLKLVKGVRKAAHSNLDMDWLKPFMSSREVRRGVTLFRKGDAANEMFFVVSGRFRLAEIGIDLQAGSIVGELGFLSPGQTRTQTLECLENGELLHITYDEVRQLYFQNPTFGFYLLRLTTQRLFENIAKLEGELIACRNPVVRALAENQS